MRFGIGGRVLVGMAVVLAAVPVVALSASRLDAVSIQSPPVVTQGELRIVQPEPRTIVVPRQQVNRLKLDSTRVAIELPVLAAPVKVTSVDVVLQEQEQEPEPWRSTRKASGADVVVPIVTRRLDPKYPPEALRAKIQGWVVVEAIVSPEGNVTAARVIKSLDTVFGLDDEAVKTAMMWKFMPGTYQGQPVALRVIIEMQFTVRRN